MKYRALSRRGFLVGSAAIIASSALARNVVKGTRGGGGGGTPFDETVGGNTGNTWTGLDVTAFDNSATFINDDNPATFDYTGGDMVVWVKMTDAARLNVKGAGTVTLTTAKLRIRKVTNFGALTVTAYNCLRDAGVTTVNGTNYDGTNPWTTAGANGSGTDQSASSIGSVSVGTGLQYYEIDLDLTTMQNIINGSTSNFGIITRSTGFSEFAGTTYGTPDLEPEFRFAGTR